MNTKTACLAFLSLLLMLGAAVLSGCDFSHVDQGRDVELAAHMEALSEASSHDEAVKAVRGTLNKVGVGLQRADVVTEEEFGAYALSNEQIDAIASKLVSFNRGEAVGAATVEQTYANFQAANEHLRRLTEESVSWGGVTPFELKASLDEVLVGFNALARTAMTEPDEPQNAFLLAILADGSTLPEGDPVLAPSKTLSPVQYLLFSMWLHRYGPRMPLYIEEEGAGKTGGGSLTCPPSLGLFAKFEWQGGRYKFEKPSGNEGLIRIRYGSQRGGQWSYTGTGDLPGSILIKGGQNTAIVTLDGQTDGGWFGNHVVGYKDISNIQFCGYDEYFNDNPTCFFFAMWKYLSCNYCGGSSAACEQVFVDWYNWCHDEGSGSQCWG